MMLVFLPDALWPTGILPTNHNNTHVVMHKQHAPHIITICYAIVSYLFVFELLASFGNLIGKHVIHPRFACIANIMKRRNG